MNEVPRCKHGAELDRDTMRAAAAWLITDGIKNHDAVGRPKKLEPCATCGVPLGFRQRRRGKCPKCGGRTNN